MFLIFFFFFSWLLYKLPQRVRKNTGLNTQEHINYETQEHKEEGAEEDKDRKW